MKDHSLAVMSLEEWKRRDTSRPFARAAPRSAEDISMDRLHATQQLSVNDQLVSNNGMVRLVMQGDGNLVLYTASFQPLWASHTWQKPVDHTIMQGDGNLVAYSSAGVPYWATGTDGHPGAWVVLQDDGNLVVYD